MYKIQTLNNISETGLSKLPAENYSISSDEKNPIGILLRSFSMHEMELPESLEAVARAGAGVNNIPIEKCAEKGIVVFNTPGANANAVKELVITSLLISSRKVTEGIAWVQGLKNETGVAKLVEKGKSSYVGPEIFGKKLGVIGLGAVGALVANACNALGMEVYGTDPFVSVDAAWRLSPEIHKASSLEEIYKECDYITVHVPLNDSTKEMFNKDSFAMMKKGMRILNFSRGELVSSDDVKVAIAEGQVACYVTDFPTEELLGVDGIITIPHLGASTPESEENCAKMAAEELREYLEQGNIVNSVNFPNCSLAFTGNKRICVLHKAKDGLCQVFEEIATKSGLEILNKESRAKGEFAYTIMDVNQTDVAKAVGDISQISEVIKVRII